LLDHEEKILRVDFHQIHRVQRHAGRAAGLREQEADFAEELAALEIGAHEFAARHLLRHPHQSAANQVKGVCVRALFAHHLAFIARNQLGLVAEIIQEILGQAGEERDAAEVIHQGAFAILVIDRFLERRALEGGRLDLGRRLGVGIHLARAQEHVENHAQHLEHHAGLLGANGGAAGLKGAAGHLAEHLARP
jgi:hypothetical protein